MIIKKTRNQNIFSNPLNQHIALGFKLFSNRVVQQKSVLYGIQCTVDTKGGVLGFWDMHLRVQDQSMDNLK